MRTCVIGAGPSGLTTIKQLLDEGHDVTCFEKNDGIGGIWYRRPSGDEDQMKVFDSVVLTVSMKLMSFSDFMPKEEGRIFYSHEKYRRYLEAYADAFDLRRHIRFDSSVTGLRKTDDGKWRVTVRSGDAQTEHDFDAVAVCSGPFKTPNTHVAGLENFQGEIVHSYRYRNNARFRGKRVLVVGLAESGADIVREISDVASECTLSLRSFSFLVPRVPGGNLATDHLTSRVHHHEMWVRATNVPYHQQALFGGHAFTRALFKLAVMLYGLAAATFFMLQRIAKKATADDSSPTNPIGAPMHPLKLDVDTPWTQENADAITAWNRRSHNGKSSWSQRIIFCKNVTFIPNIVNGKIAVQSSGIARTEGARVFFGDGTVKDFDTVVLCTGFVNDFSAFGGEDIVKDNNVRNLYKHAFHPRHEGRLAFIGFVRPFSGGIPICSEMQARYFALLCSGKRKLPENVDELIAADKAWEEALTELSPRATESIPSQALFIDSIAKEVGCLMPVSSLLLSPRLLVRHWFYPFNQACYRLTGPHSMYETAIAEMMREERVLSIKRILHFLGLSLLPHFLHPEHGGDMAGPERERAPRVQIAEQEI